jgi:SAM-dependent methyltransferase
MIKKMTREKAIEANIYVHSFLVGKGEYQKSPHFRPENVSRVKGILDRLVKDLPSRASKATAIDFGCGTGFMIDLIHERFHEVHGVDITRDMMKEVDLSPGNIFLHEVEAENTSFPNESFDFATAYSFMDHLYDYQKFLREAYRVLKHGGIFYSDLNPNRDFIRAMAHAEKVRSFASDIVDREIQGALHNGSFHEADSGVDAALVEMAEPIKTHAGGFCFEEVLDVATEIGFSKVKVEFQWYLGQARVLHQQNSDNAEFINNYLLSILPVSSALFKYLRFVFVK